MTVARHPHGFTLVEILVCMAIVSLLAALAFPAFLALREGAHRIHCLSNLRQVGFAFGLYAEDFRHYLPHEDAGGGGDPPIDCAWFDVLDTYLTGENLSEIKQCPSFRGDIRWHSYKMNALLEDAEMPFYRLGTARREESAVLLFDARTDNAGVRTQTKGTWRSAAPRHRGGTNLLFLDNHVEWHKPRLTEAGYWMDAGPFVWDWRE